MPTTTEENYPEESKFADEGAAAMIKQRRWYNKGFADLSRKTTHEAFVSLVDQGVISVTNFLTGVIIGRICTKEEFGLYMLGLSVVLFMINVQQSIISSPYTFFCPRLAGKERSVFTGSTIIHQWGLSALAVISLSMGGLILSMGIGPEGLAPVSFALAVTICFIMMRQYARRVCFARLQMKVALLLDMCVAVIQTGGLLFLAILGKLSPPNAFLIIGSSCGIAAITWLIWMRKEFMFRLDVAVSDMKRNWKFGRWVFWGNMTTLMSTELYTWFVTSFHGTAATGVLSACMGIVALANPFLLGIDNLIGPKTAHAYARGGVVELRRVVFKTTNLLAAIICLFCMVIFLAGGKLVTTIYGAKYSGTGFLLSILSVGLLASALNIAMAYGLWAMERPDINFKISLLSLGITVTAGLWMVKHFGLLGVAFGLLTVKAISVVGRYVIFTRLIRNDPVASASL